MTSLRKYFPVAVKSALAAGLFLGLPAGLLLWLILLRQAGLSARLDPYIAVLQAYAWGKIIVLVISSFGWSYLLGRISGYRLWWKIGLATALGILAGWVSPLSNLDGWFSDDLPIHALYALAMSGIVASVTLCVGLAYGLLLRSARAALSMALTTSLASVLALMLAILLFDLSGIRVGGGVPFAMSKVTTVSLLFSSVAGGAALGVGFSWFVRRNIP
jgi:hypothetical protein